MAFVTRSNWKEASVEARARIEEAAFVAVDLEMSGVQTTAWRAGTEVDTLETRYFNLRDSAEKFSVLQFGLCPFLWDAAHGKFVAYPYNFCLFPRDELPIPMPARDFLCQATSLEFLAKHKFDFNACIHDGVSYLSREQERIARVRLGLSGDIQPGKAPPEIPLTRTSDVLFSEKVRVQVGEWRDSSQKDCGNKSPSLLIDVSGSHQANLVHQVLRKSFKDLVPFTEDGMKQVKVLFPRSTKERAAMLLQWEKNKKERVESQLMEAVGFRQIVDALISSGKPVVGHNCFLDFAHIYSKFVAPLPSSCKDFCSSIHQHFQCILDTKYLLKSDPSIREIIGERSTTLGVVYEQFCKLGKQGETSSQSMFNGVKVEIGTEASRYDGTESKHEAGYDAFMTGVVFANICHLLTFDPASLPALPEQAKSQISGLPSYANLLYLGWLSHFVLDLTTGKEATGVKSLKMHRQWTSNRCDRVALLWGCSALDPTQDLQQHVKNCFKGCTRSVPEVDVIPVDDDSAFLIFKTKQPLEILLHAFENGSTPQAAELCNFETLLASGFKIARFETFEKLCQSPLSTAKLADSVELLLLHIPEDTRGAAATSCDSMPEQARKRQRL